MKITAIETFIMHVPVSQNLIGDSTHTITHWGMPGVRIMTDAGLVGYGYTGTHADLPTDKLITAIIADVFGPMLIGSDPTQVRHLHRKLERSSVNIWVGRGGLTQMALSAIDIALWDLKAKAAGQPLWQVFGGSSDVRVEAYNTDCGWLVRDVQQLVDECRHMIEVEGFTAIKMKVGKPDPKEDLCADRGGAQRNRGCSPLDDRRQRQMVTADCQAIYASPRRLQHYMVRGATLARRCLGASCLGKVHEDSHRARRIALHAR